MKKIFVLTGETSGYKLASKAINELQNLNPEIEYLSVGGEYLNSIKIKSIYDLKEITYLGFSNVIFNLFRIRKKINKTVEEIIKFNPNILFSVDSPDFTLRVAKKVKQKNPNIKTIHFVAPKVYVWRENRVKKLKSYLDHILLLFPFEKKYFDNENMPYTYVGHPLLDSNFNNSEDLTNKNIEKKNIISIFPGSRLSEINTLMPIINEFIKLVQKKYINFSYVFHATKEFESLIKDSLSGSLIKNCEVISEENAKQSVLSRTAFAIAKSGTISLEICQAGVPSIIIYKMNFINFFIIKMLVKIRYANIFNIIANEEVIPELLQSQCNPNKIYEVFKSFIENPELQLIQKKKYNEILKQIKVPTPANKKIAMILNHQL